VTQWWWGTSPSGRRRQSRETLLAPFRERADGPEICVIHAVTGMRGTGKTQAAAAYARQRVAEKWRLVAWINADNIAAILDGLAQVAIAAGIPTGDDQPAATRAVRHWLEADGEQFLIVFDNAPEPDTLRPYLPAVGAAHIVITSNRQSVTSLGISLPIEVFSSSEALAYLAQRTCIDDTRGARDLADELGCLPLALAQAAAVITAQHITYSTYLYRLRTFPLTQYLTRTEQDPYPYAVAAAILISLQTACDSDATGLAAPLMNMIALLSPAGVTRSVLHAAFRAGTLFVPDSLVSRS
jgi:hypothetical protein